MAEQLEDKIQIEGDYSVANLNSLYLKAKSRGQKKDKIFKVITSVDAGEQWSIYNKKIRKSQSLPISNYLSTSRDTRQGALSVTGFTGDFEAKSMQMEVFAPKLTDALTSLWRQTNFDEAIDSALESMLTYGTGITMVSRNDMPINSGNSYVTLEGIKLINIDPMQLYPDPAAKNEDEATYYFIKDTATINHLRSIPLFKDAIDLNYDKICTNISRDAGLAHLHSDFDSNQANETDADYIIYIGKVIMSDGSERWDMIYMFGGVIIHKVEGLLPNKCPLVFVRERRDKKSFWGQSSFKHNLALQLAVNELDSAFITHAKAQQDPIAILDATSGINMADFVANRDKPGRTFLAARNTKDAVHYQELPNLPNNVTEASMLLVNRIRETMGTDDIYAGAGSGSLQTSGGISQVLQRAGLKDVKVIKHFQHYLRRLYELIIENLKLHPGVIRYASQDHAEGDMQYNEIDMELIDWKSIALVVDIFNHTGSAKERNSQTIEMLFQNSVQYSAAQPITEPAIMTADEYLEGIKNPNLHKLIAQIQERRKREREMDMSAIVAQIIQLYLTIVSEGITPQEAIIMVSQEYSTDPGILKGFSVAELAKQQSQAAETNGMQGQNEQA